MLDKLGRAEIVRIYGKELNVWTVEMPHPYWDDETMTIRTQVELEYKDYDSETGELVAVGSEDFSTERFHKEYAVRDVWTWDGEKHNAGGYRWFECRGFVKFRKRDRKALTDYLKIKYPDAELIKLR